MPNLIIKESYNVAEQELQKPLLGLDHSKIIDWVRRAEVSTPETKWREDALLDYQFYAGEQDDADTLAELEGKNRPNSTYNEILPKINMLVGLAAQTKHDVNVVPVGSEDEALAELATNLLKHFRTQLKCNRKELECFEHTVKSGRSFLQYYVDSSNPFEPEIKCRRLEGHQVFIDPKAREYDLSDARFIAVENWLTEEEILAQWPGVNVMSFTGGSSLGDVDKPEFFNEARQQWRILEVWYIKYEETYWVVNPLTGQIEETDAKGLSQLQRAFKQGFQVGEQWVQQEKGVEFTKSIKKNFYYRIYIDTLILEEGKNPFTLDRFPIVFYGAYRNDNTNAWFSPIKPMRDPQIALNTMRRQLSHLLQVLPKGLLVHETGAVLNIEEYEERSADPTFHLELSAGGLEKIKFQQQPSISPIYQTFDETCSQGMKNTSGIQNELMGVQTTSREPGVSVRMRQETNLAVLFSLYDNFKESRKVGNEILFSLAQQYTTNEKVIRITGQTGQMLMKVNSQLNPNLPGFNDITVGKYDVVMEETTETTTTRLAVMQMLSDVNVNNPGAIPASLIMEYSDLPYSAKTAIKQYETMAQQAAEAQQNFEKQVRLKELELKEREVIIKEKELSIEKSAAEEGKKENTSNKGE